MTARALLVALIVLFVALTPLLVRLYKHFAK